MEGKRLELETYLIHNQHLKTVFCKLKVAIIKIQSVDFAYKLKSTGLNTSDLRVEEEGVISVLKDWILTP